MNLGQLPRELTDIILQYLSKYDLRSLSLVNRAMRQLAATELWSTVHIGNVKQIIPKTRPIRGVHMRTTTAFRRFLKEFDRSLLKYVRTLHIGNWKSRREEPVTSWISSKLGVGNSKSFDELLRVMSSKCTNLKTLRYETLLVDHNINGRLDVEKLQQIRELFVTTPQISILVLSLRGFEVSQLPTGVTGLEMADHLRSLEQNFLRTISERCKNMEYVILLNGMYIYNLDWLVDTIEYVDLDKVRFSDNRRFWDGQRGHPVRDHVASPNLKYLRFRRVDRRCLAMLDCPVLDTLIIEEHDCDPTRDTDPVVAAFRRCPKVRCLSIHGCNYELLARLLDECNWSLEKLVVLGPHNDYDNKHELEAAALAKFTNALSQHKSLRGLFLDKFDERVPYPEADRGDDFLVWNGGERQRSWNLFDLALLFEPLATNCCHISHICVRIYSLMGQEKRYRSSTGLSVILPAVILPTSTAVTENGEFFAELYATKHQSIARVYRTHKLDLHVVAQLQLGVPVEGL